MEVEDEIEFQNGRNVYQFNITPRVARRPGTTQRTSWERNVFQDSVGNRAAPAGTNTLQQGHYMKSVFVFVFIPILGFIRQVIVNLRWPTSVLLSLVIFNQALAPYMAAAVLELLHPLCHVPIIGRVCPAAVNTPTPPTPPVAPAATSHPVIWADYPSLMDLQSKAVHQLYDEGTEGLIGSSLSTDIRKSQMATTDLVVLVNVSNLMSKDDIAGILIELAAISTDLAKNLTGLEVGVIGSLNRILTVNNFAINFIEAKKNRSLRTIVADLFSREGREAAALAESFEYVMSVLSTELGDILLRCDAIQELLDLTDGKLMLLHELLQREQMVVSAAKGELLAELWTMLGGNKRKVHDIRAKVRLLKDLMEHRREAKLVIAAITQGVGVLIEDLEQLRIRVAQPAIKGSTLPNEVQLQSIKAGVEHIQHARYLVHQRHLRKASGVVNDEYSLE